MKIHIDKVKYLHILWHNAPYFNKQFVDMINCENAYFNSNDHAFITPYKDLYDELNNNKNVYLVDNGNLINDYGEAGDWIFVHSLNCNIFSFLCTKKKYAKKVIWRTWGHDVLGKRTPHYKSIVNTLKTLIRTPIVKYHQHKVSQFFAIAVANDVDTVKVKSIWKNARIFQISYSYAPGRKELLENITKETGAKNSEVINIMVGHSSSAGDRHIEVLNMLEKYSKENILVHLFLYGATQSDYGIQVVSKAKEIFGEKVIVHSTFVPYEEYAYIAASMDVALLASKTSSALGTLQILLYFNKKVFVDPTGDIAKAAEYHGIPINSLEQISQMSFKEFCQIDQNNSARLRNVFGQVYSVTETCTEFKNILDTLNMQYME